MKQMLTRLDVFPLAGQEGLTIEPSYVVVGNAPLVLREGMLVDAYDMV